MIPSGQRTTRQLLRLRRTIASSPSASHRPHRSSSRVYCVSRNQSNLTPGSISAFSSTSRSRSLHTSPPSRSSASSPPWTVPVAASSYRRQLSTAAAAEAAAGAPSSSGDEASSVIVTDACAERLKDMAAADGGKPKVLRVCVEGGGCAGFQYKFEFDDNITKFDTVFEKNDQKVVVDDISLEYLKGSTINFTTEMIRSAFTVEDNPNSEAGCGCGESFTPKGV